MKRWLIILAILLLLALLIKFGVPEGNAPSPSPTPTEEPADPAPAPVEAESPVTEPAASAKPEKKVTEHEPVPDLGLGREGQVPAELLGTGDALLKLWLIDGDTGAPVAMPVTLWRLGVAEGNGWTGGDQIQMELPVAVGGAQVPDLPEGRYRLQCDEQRKGAPDPAGFTIEAGENVRHIKVLRPRKFHALLRVFDLEGNEIRAGLLETGRTGEHNKTTYRAPKWAKPRGPIKGRGYGLFGGRGDHLMTGWDPRPSNLAGDRGFDLGLHRESTRFRGWGGLHRLRVEGFCDVWASVSSDLARDVTLCGVVVPVEKMIECLRLPEGTDAKLADAKITARCLSAIHEGGAPFATAKKSKFRVWIDLPGFMPLRYTWLLDQPTTPKVLQPKM